MFSFNELWYWFSTSLLELVDGVEAVFYWLAGVKPANIPPGTNYIPQISDSSLVYDMFNQGIWQTIFFFFMALVIGVLYGVSGQDTVSLGTIIGQACFGSEVPASMKQEKK